MRKVLQLFLALSLTLLLLPQTMQAQERTITGTIVAEDSKAPLAGVTVRVKGTRKITQTDANGKFTLRVSPGEVIQVSYVGYVTTDIKPGDSGTLGISLKTADNTMGEVVVTAMDIKRNPRSLGYSVQKVDGTEIQETQRENFLNSLGGRVAGLTIDPTSGTAGASTSIVLRGYNSLSLSNQPLYVVDGVVLDNSTINETSGGGQDIGLASDRPNRNTDYQNRIADLNPSDIETVTILKGPEATALYGSQASSGAIVITTRKAKTNKLGIQYDNNFRFQKVTRWPETLDEYENGQNGVASNVYTYFGPKYAEGTQLYDNKDAFFRTGTAQTHNLGADFGIGESKFRVSGSYFNQKGVVPENDYKRLTLRISNTTKFFKGKLELSPSFAYTNTDNNKVLRSAGGYLLSLLIWPTTNDIRNFEDPNGDKLGLFNSNPNADYDNPLFNVKKNRAYDNTDRMTYTMGVNFTPYSWLSLSGRFGYDTYKMYGYQFYHPQSYYLSAATGGTLDNYWRKYYGYNHTITATGKKKLGKHTELKLMAGTMWQDYETQMFSIYGTNIVDNVQTDGKMYKNGSVITDQQLQELMGNYMDSSVTRTNTRQRLLQNNSGRYNQSILRQFAYFGEFSVSYKNFAFLSYTHRFEEASTLPEKNRKYNYPGGSLSLIMSDIIPGLKKGSILSYWKLRTSLAGTARLNPPYSTQSVFVNNFASGGGYSYGFFNNNADLEPERQKTYELGTEFRLFSSRLNLDVTYYNTLNKGQIINAFRLSYGTGFVLNTQNAASTRNQGVEVALSFDVLKKTGLKWNTRMNFNKMWNKVEDMPRNVAEYYIADTWLYGNARGGLVFGGATTTITSYGYARNTAGQILINPLNGLPVVDATFKVRGDRNPDFTLGWLNNFSWKRWKLSMLWDLKVGGDIFNGNNMFLTRTGRSKLTADRMQPRVIAGVLNNGLQNSATPTQNTIVINPYFQQDYYTTMPEEAFIEKDVNWFRMRDLSISYTFSQNFIKGIKNLSAFFTANDLILMTNYSGADPMVNGNTSGSRGVGAFGFDYGTLPAAVTFNFGFRASL
ncbi:MAG: SusC/RagA family TonB-linked outer membrane protein [Chitinophagaceae bacterium]|nr:SusC/RagA family TonB-linked outer membrane protein [Chitinophagaceae bacterium]